MPQRFHFLDSLAVALFEGRARRIRGLVATVYAILALLAALQLVSPGAVERIAAQPVGLGLLGSLSALLFASGLCVLGGVALWRAHSALDLGVGDALLSLSLGLTGLDLLFGELWVSAPVAALALGAAGLATAGAGLHRVALALLNRRPASRAEYDASPGPARRSSQLLRGAVFVTLGGLLFASAAGHLDGQTLHARSDLVAIGLFAGVTIALGGYAVHLLWSMSREDSLGLS